MEPFTVLSVCWCIGIASGRRSPEEYLKTYGESERLRLFTIAEYLYFEPQDGSDTESILWRRRAPSLTRRGRHGGDFFLIEELTQADSGIYTVKTKLNTINTYNITVSPIEKTFILPAGDQLHFELPMNGKTLPYSLITVTFTNEFVMDVLFSMGELTARIFDERLEIGVSPLSSLTVHIFDLQLEDSGVFEIRDRNNNLAMQVHLVVTEAQISVWLLVGVSVAVVVLGVLCCCCLKRCCCKKSSKSAAGNSQHADPQPNPPRYLAEPRQWGNPVDAYAYRPAAPASNFEMGSPAPVPLSTLPYPSAPSAQGPSACNFLSSENEPRFQMKGMMGPSPLYSECVSADVYTSDKLNFSVL